MCRRPRARSGVPALAGLRRLAAHGPSAHSANVYRERHALTQEGRNDLSSRCARRPRGWLEGLAGIEEYGRRRARRRTMRARCAPRVCAIMCGRGCTNCPSRSARTRSRNSSKAAIRRITCWRAGSRGRADRRPARNRPRTHLPSEPQMTSSAHHEAPRGRASRQFFASAPHRSVASPGGWW